MRLVPRSLFSRLVLVLFGGLLIAHALSLGIHAHERGQLLLQASGMQSAQRIADIVRVLEPLPANERRKMVAILSAPPLVIRLGDGRWSAAASGERRAHAALFETMIRRFAGDEWPVSVSVADAPAWKGASAMPGARGPGMHDWMRMERGPHVFLQSGMSFLAHVRLHDGTTVTFDSQQPAETLTWPYRVLVTMVILFGAVLVLSLIAVRWATRPLLRLADAAEELGRNIHRPPLDESGPLEVQRAARAFNTMQARLTSYIQDRTRILAAMSHDLKTPITRLRLRSELLDDVQLRAKFGKDLEELEAMVSGTLDFMRGLESEEQVQPTDVNALLESLRADLLETGGGVEIEGAAKSPYAGKPLALKRCLSNLIDNAAKYGDKARVVVDDDEKRLEIRILDEGPGIPEAALERVFDPFYRLEASRNRETGGTGLGLTIARSIAQSHGGRLSLRNRVEGGLEAILVLPRGRSAA